MSNRIEGPGLEIRWKPSLQLICNLLIECQSKGRLANSRRCQLDGSTLRCPCIGPNHKAALAFGHRLDYGLLFICWSVCHLCFPLLSDETRSGSIDLDANEGIALRVKCQERSPIRTTLDDGKGLPISPAVGVGACSGLGQVAQMYDRPLSLIGVLGAGHIHADLHGLDVIGVIRLRFEDKFLVNF